jgi:GntR family transcriptional regulator
MVLDVLLELDVAVGSARTKVTPRLITARDAAGRAFGVQRATAVLELEEVMYLTSGEPVQWSSDVFAPGGIDLHVRRALESSAPAPIRLAT